MQTSMLVSWRSRSRESKPEYSWTPRTVSFFDKHPVGEIVRGLVFSSVLWGLLAVGVYAVYSMVLGAR
ncbi:hypothetical protein [Edaphobacter flagellatus]|uniref:hypothetical protein n=1 Tax=Edaphobacter flagellatus TaxID=1933044 RepID=UPI0021B207ED|nr:hypothetical protein [Edaphobacter flagellatus]